jgi:hypothetical protein
MEILKADLARPVNFAYSSLLSLATNVTGVTVPLSGHWIPEEQPNFVIDQLSKFFGNITNNSKIVSDYE